MLILKFKIHVKLRRIFWRTFSIKAGLNICDLVIKCFIQLFDGIIISNVYFLLKVDAAQNYSNKTKLL